MEESLKRLKKGRGTDKSSGSHGFTDDDKIRQQVVLDIENYGQQVNTINYLRKQKFNFCVCVSFTR